MDAILARYPKMVVVWAHMGLCKELQTLHPLIHSHIMRKLFDRYPNLNADTSWDVVSKLLLRNVTNLTPLEKLQQMLQLLTKINELRPQDASPNLAVGSEKERELVLALRAPKS